MPSLAQRPAVPVQLGVFGPKVDADVTNDLLRRGKASAREVARRAASRDFLNKPHDKWTEADVVKLLLGRSHFLHEWLRHINADREEDALQLGDFLAFLRTLVYRWWTRSSNGTDELVDFGPSDADLLQSFS